jgi:hypothetical protein
MVTPKPRLYVWRGCPSSHDPLTVAQVVFRLPVQALPLQPPQNGEAFYVNDCMQATKPILLVNLEFPLLFLFQFIVGALHRVLK